MNKIQTFIIKITGIGKIFENHKKALEALATANNSNIDQFIILSNEVSKNLDLIQDSIQVLYNSIPKEVTHKSKKLNKIKAKKVKKVIHKKNKKTLA